MVKSEAAYAPLGWERSISTTCVLFTVAGVLCSIAGILSLALYLTPPLDEARMSCLPPRRDTMYNTSAGTVPGKVNVHLVPHSHNDVGWLKTVDQYFSGARLELQTACVEFTLDTVIDQLIKNPDRKFVQVEQAYFNMWWRKQSESRRDDVRELARLGQLEFINGGWCMHDEAATHYVDMIDQTSLGHRFIKSEFGVTPKAGWQIDTFGHSAVQGYLLGAEAGFDGVFFARAHYQDAAKRNKEKSNEFVWRGSDSLGDTAQIFGGRMFHNYMPPVSFNFEYRESSDDLHVRDDPALNDYNLNERVESFVLAALEQAKYMRTDHIMWAMGDDFAYLNANTWYKNLDKLIHYANLDGRVHALYSTPSLYTYSKHSANETWPLKKGDFFPYADCPHCYWTGYFTSRPGFKGFIRQNSALLLAARQLEVAAGASPGCLTPLQSRSPPSTPLQSQPRAFNCCGLGSDDSRCWSADFANPEWATVQEQEHQAPGFRTTLHSQTTTTSATAPRCPPNTIERALGPRYDKAGEGEGSTVLLEEALAIAQHHDGVSGTAKQHVTDDYTKRLHRGAVEARSVVASAAAALFRTCGARVLMEVGKGQKEDVLLGVTHEILNSTYATRIPQGAYVSEDYGREGEGDKTGKIRDETNASSGVRGTQERRALERLSAGVDDAARGEASRKEQGRVADEGGREALDTPQEEQQNCLGAPLSFSACPLLNISYCPASQEATGQARTLSVVAYNPLAWERHEYVRVPVVSADVAVSDSSGNAVESQILRKSAVVPFLRSFYVEAHGGEGAEDPLIDEKSGSTLEAPYTLVFRAALPPLGHAVYYVSPYNGDGDNNGERKAAMSEEKEVNSESQNGGNQSPFAVYFKDGQGHAEEISGEAAGADVRAEFTADGHVSSIYLPAEEGVSQGRVTITGDTLQCYNTMGKPQAGRNPSGAYLFRPVNQSSPCPAARLSDGTPESGGLPRGTILKLQVFTGPLVVEVLRHDVDWGAQVFRFYRDEHDVELQYAVGPVPMGDLGNDGGREVAQRFSTDLKSDKTFFTDSNGRDYIKRVRDHRDDWDLTVTEPVAGNYYPLNSGLYISDGVRDLSVLVDRAAGGTSLKSGQIEIMLHRRTKTDDDRGVNEALNETVCVRRSSEEGTVNSEQCMGLMVIGTVHLGAHPSAQAVRWRRNKAQRKFSPLQVSFAHTDSAASVLRSAAKGNQELGFMNDGSYSLPPNVAVITLQKLEHYILLRLAHLYQSEEDPELSSSAQVDLRQLFSKFQITHAEELSLTANQKMEERRKAMVWNVEGEDSVNSNEKAQNRGKGLDSASMLVELGPMEVRTFAVYTVLKQND